MKWWRWRTTIMRISVLILVINQNVAPYDANFACCGGCSSHKRADAYNGKLASGAKIFIWDTKLQTDPADVCLLTFPYDPGLNEQEGDRRVRSGRLVGTTYPIDHDYDSLCCEQRGQCLASEEDASGKCRCVTKWGFTGDHCQYSIYDVAAVNNSQYFPKRINLTSVHALLPDVRKYLVKFDYEEAIAAYTKATEEDHDEASSDVTIGAFFIDVLTLHSYRQYGWTLCTFALALAGFFVLVFLFHLLWNTCCFRCGCRKKNLTKHFNVYSRAQKLVCGTFMCVSLMVAVAGAVMTSLPVLTKIVPSSDSISFILSETLPDELVQFQTNFLSPLNELVTKGYASKRLFLPDLQKQARQAMASHHFLDNLTAEQDVISEPVFAILDGLANYSLLFPTATQLSCADLTIKASIVSRMTIGATTGCFKCKTCATLMDLVAAAKDNWRRNPFAMELDLLLSQHQLQEFGDTEITLELAINTFRKQINRSCLELLEENRRISVVYDQFVREGRQIAVFGLFGLIGVTGLVALLGVCAFSRGVTTDKRPLTRMTCFFAEIALLLSIFLVGVLYSIAMLAHDGIAALEIFTTNTTAFFLSMETSADVRSILFDTNLIDAHGMNETLAFADTLRVPPHPTPTDDDPSRFDIASLYDFPDLFALQELAAEPENTIKSLFGWEETFADQQWEWLKVLAFGNASVTSPYNENIHQELLNSTLDNLMDPDQDSVLVSDADLVKIESVFNESWHGVSDYGVHQNRLISTQWLFVCQLNQQKQHLLTYSLAISDIINSTRPLLADLIVQTAAMEDAEFQLKAPVEFFTDAIRRSKIQDCTYNNNCGWLQEAVNDMFQVFQDIITQAERAVICCGVTVFALLMGTVFTDCFARRLRRNVVKVYSGN